MAVTPLLFRVALALPAAVLGAGAAQAQTPAYPTKSIRMIIALAPGGGVDTTGRLIDFVKAFSAEIAKWAKVVKATGVDLK